MKNSMDNGEKKTGGKVSLLATIAVLFLKYGCVRSQKSPDRPAKKNIRNTYSSSGRTFLPRV